MLKPSPAALARLTVPVRAADANDGNADDGRATQPPGAAKAEPEDESIRRMIEAAYT